MINALPYISGTLSVSPRPLSRYLPPVPDGVISTWLIKNVKKGAWVIDPFCASPRLIIEAARAGYRVLATVSNPIASFLLEIAANRASQADFRSALSELASTFIGTERVEPFILSLYQTTCAACGQSVIADAFLWEKGANAPYAKIYKCQRCGDDGEHHVNESDIRMAVQYSASGLHRARALERVTLPNDPDRPYVEEAIAHYPPRGLFILFTLLNRLDGLNTTQQHRQYLQALLLHAFDHGNTLWAVPTARPRPRQLVTPPRYRENNIWFALEQAIEMCGEVDSPLSVPLVNWPEEPPAEGGICLFEGRFKDLGSSISSLSIGAVITAIPRHNQAFWTLSALWAGWLWGREAVGPFKVVLRRRWYDWAWHTAALYLTLQHVATNLNPGTPFFGLLSETEAGFLTASLTAADAAGFSLEGLAIREDDGQTQILWKQNTQRSTAELPSGEQIVTQNIQDYLFERAEPASYLLSIAAGLQGLTEYRIPWIEMNPVSHTSENIEPDAEGQASSVEDQSTHPRPHRLYMSINTVVRKALSNRSIFTNFAITEKGESTAGGEKSHTIELESGLYWLYHPRWGKLSLSDRVEMVLVRYLSKNTSCTYRNIQDTLYADFPGLLTPDEDIIVTCLESYGVQLAGDAQMWGLRKEDLPTARHKDLHDVEDQLRMIGERLGFRVDEQIIQDQPSRKLITWSDMFDQPHYRFFPIASAVISDLLLNDENTAAIKQIIVLPGSRSNLVMDKLRRDPRFKEQFEPFGNWSFLKFRHLRWLGENPLLSRESFPESLGLDPLTYSTSQLRLL